ncbi:unnamed protein product [Triticum turgidum subsp. durum]|uniref:Major facilitator superfamily (MFS) profile domain-containing protein n=1 Tax=Triticum turgidum subsp. durum TaxID=4567 RepID=A0A9R1RP59_TRITD|nr:unnamed protein product [Triticum turgidum subsp. durum]
MAGGAFVADGGRAQEYGGRMTFSVVVTSLMAASCGLIFGYDSGVTGGVTQMESFLSKFFPEVQSRMKSPKRDAYCKYDNQWLTAFTSSLFIAGTLSSLVASRVTRRVGRQAIMLIGGVMFLAGSIINAAAVNIAMLIIGRILLGFGLGFTLQVAISWVMAGHLGKHQGVTMPHGYATAVLVLICLCTFSFGVSWAPLRWVVPSEIYPVEIRSAGQAMSISVALCLSFVELQVFIALLCAMKYGVFLFYAGWLLTMTIFVAAFLPETKGVPLEAMQSVWTGHWYWRRFVKDANHESQITGVSTN